MKAEVAPDCADTGAPGGLELVSQKCRRANVAAVSSGPSLCVCYPRCSFLPLDLVQMSLH